MVDQSAFRAQLERDGYEVREVQWKPETVNEMHTHPFDARALCLSGQITIETADGATTCSPGDQFELAAEVPHAERIGAEGVQLLAGRRHPA